MHGRVNIYKAGEDYEDRFVGWFRPKSATRFDAVNYPRDGFIRERNLFVTAGGKMVWNPWSNVCGSDNDRYILAENDREVVEWAIKHENTELFDLVPRLQTVANELEVK